MPAKELTERTRSNPSGSWVYVAALAGVVVALWAFPALWYRPAATTSQSRLWLKERNQIEGWSFQAIPVAERAENLLVADALFSGVFTNLASGQSVQVFSAKRYSQKPDEIGLFMHTPDRCWTDAGWSLQPVTPDSLGLEVHGVRMQFERRLFVHQSQRELVYFGGMVGGQPVPYRLDHNLSVGMKRAMRVAAGGAESGVRAADTRFWGRIWRGFVDRNPLLGPKQFVRISTPCPTEDLADKDRLLQDFLSRWLEPSDYEAELLDWASAARHIREGSKPPADSATSGGSW